MRAWVSVGFGLGMWFLTHVAVCDPTQKLEETSSVAGETYRIRVGDTVRSVAAHFHMTPEDFVNQLRKPFRPGQIIFVNPPGKSALQAENEEDLSGSYEVKPGDTLESIAEAHQVSEEELGQLNGKAVEDTVLPGEKLADIARRHHVRMEQLADWNECFPSDTLYPGTKLIVGWEKFVPGEIIWYPLSSRAIEHIHLETVNREYVAYTVRSGDTVERIAQKRNCTADELRDVNALGDGEQPRAGELIFLPKSGSAPLPRGNAVARGVTNVRDGVVIRAAQIARDSTGASPSPVSKGTHLSIVGEWGNGYAVLVKGQGYGWISRESVHIGSYLPPPPPSETSARIIQIAYTYLGVPYLFGGNTFKGIDCSAFVKDVLVASGVWRPSAPRVACDQMHVGVPVTPDQLQPGDRVYFYYGRTPPGTADHTGLYIGGGQVIHASSAHGVTVSCLFTGSLWRHYIGACRDSAASHLGGNFEMPGKPAARVSDPTTHGAPLSPGPGSATVMIGNLPAWRATIDQHACPAVSISGADGVGSVMLGSPTVFIEHQMACRQEDIVVEKPGLAMGPSNPILLGLTTVLIGDSGGAGSPPAVAMSAAKQSGAPFTQTNNSPS